MTTATLMDSLHTGTEKIARAATGAVQDRRMPNNPPPKWKLTIAMSIFGTLVGGVGGIGGAYLALRVNNAVQETRLQAVEKKTDALGEHLRDHEINGGIHYYRRPGP